MGTDINILPAWDITTGCNSIIVAVVDEGLEINHPDFNNILTTSYDAETGTSPSQVHGNHGVAVAGIIGATANNGIGVAGVAPDVKLMSISVELGVAAPLTSLKLSDGINFAWQNGAHVINNSWASDAITSQQLIIDAIDDAVFFGRGGLGAVMVFATGNDNVSGIYFPYGHSDVLAVGAMSMCEERKHSYNPLSCDHEAGWGSNYGPGLDVIAPGVLITTTDRQSSAGYNPDIKIHTDFFFGDLVTNDYGNLDYTIWFNGTSSAAPQVSGIAALILSVNPGLTQQEVRKQMAIFRPKPWRVVIPKKLNDNYRSLHNSTNRILSNTCLSGARPLEVHFTRAIWPPSISIPVISPSTKQQQPLLK